MPLSDIMVRNAKAGPKCVRIRDERGLYLQIDPNGSKKWRFRYLFSGKENMLSLGLYPDVSLKDARERRDQARKLLANGIDPGAARRAAKEEASKTVTFEQVAREWHSKYIPTWTTKTSATNLQRLEHNVFPFLGNRSAKEIMPSELLATLRRIEARGARSTAHRVHQLCEQVFRYAVASGLAERNPAGDLRGALAPAPKKHFASVTDPKGISALLQAIDTYQGSFVVQTALRLAPLVFVRPGELRRAEWSEVDLVVAEWRIPAAKMKMRLDHIVPLSRQAVSVLHALQALTGQGAYIFPSIRTDERPMSENTVNVALRAMGFGKDEMTGHGFRSMASTILHEQGWPSDVIERQLAHSERNTIKAAYNRAEHLPERRRMMQAWADYLDGLKTGENKP